MDQCGPDFQLGRVSDETLKAFGPVQSGPRVSARLAAADGEQDAIAVKFHLMSHLVPVGTVSTSAANCIARNGGGDAATMVGFERAAVALVMVSGRCPSTWKCVSPGLVPARIGLSSPSGGSKLLSSGNRARPAAFASCNGKPRRWTMSDDKTLRAPRDASRIALGEGYEVRYWTKKFSVSRDRLEQAVRAVGNSAVAVERHLKG